MSIAFLLLMAVTATGTAPAPEPAPAAPAARQSGLSIAGVPFSRADIASVEASFDDVAMPIVLLNFSETGDRKFQAVQQGRVGQQLEVALDGEILVSPYLVEPIAGAQLSIGGSFTREETERLAARLRNLPAE